MWLAGRARCLCCGFLTLEHPDAQALCPVCWWQDDGQDDSDAHVVRGTVNAGLSLSMARDNFRLLGAAHESYLAHVRRPLPSEMAAASRTMLELGSASACAGSVPLV